MLNCILLFLKMHVKLLNRTHHVVSTVMCTNHIMYKSECSHSSTAQDSSLLGRVTVCVVPQCFQGTIILQNIRSYIPSKRHISKDMKHQITHNSHVVNASVQKFQLQHHSTYSDIIWFWCSTLKAWHSNSTSQTFFKNTFKWHVFWIFKYM